ncbi:hypothetical protein DMH27_21630 [Raoultella planticola]|nr:hypothetical protein [Raoultella planticola]
MVGADANAAAKYDDKGVAPVAASASGVAKDTSSLPSKVNVYEITEKGLAAQAMLNGYKYWPDEELNKDRPHGINRSPGGNPLPERERVCREPIRPCSIGATLM